MARMTSKITMKIEPRLLEIIQQKADSEGLALSSYIRKAVIGYIGGRKEDNPGFIRFEMTPLEIRAINRLRGLGIVSKEENAFHNAFDFFLKQEYDNIVSRAKEMIVDDHLTRGVDLRGLPTVRDQNGPETRADMDLVLEDEDI
ncbi:MAG: hypothetical protein JW939_02180 [Candidatus Thermoplasmatota archaeon]|nr:hypothetical protein [Candidatus Thermoplasmatota archaeon]